MTQHAGLDAARWATFDLDDQILMIGNEMHRATRQIEAGRTEAALRCYERVLRLTDLTVSCRPAFGLLRELLRWRDLVAAAFLSGEPDAAAHRATFRALLQLRPRTAKQIPLLLAE